MIFATSVSGRFVKIWGIYMHCGQVPVKPHIPNSFAGLNDSSSFNVCGVDFGIN